jgi:hypothetical protein
LWLAVLVQSWFGQRTIANTFAEWRRARASSIFSVEREAALVTIREDIALSVYIKLNPGEWSWRGTLKDFPCLWVEYGSVTWAEDIFWVAFPSWDRYVIEVDLAAEVSAGRIERYEAI